MLGKHTKCRVCRDGTTGGTNAPAQISRAPHEKREDATSRVRDPSYRLVPTTRAVGTKLCRHLVAFRDKRRVTVVGSDASQNRRLFY
jgi:hypothetical protein